MPSGGQPHSRRSGVARRHPRPDGPRSSRVAGAACPTTPTTHLINDFNALSCAFPVDPDLLPSAEHDVVGTRDQGSRRGECSNLGTELARLRTMGATADGALGDPNPMKAIEKTLGQSRFDEIILSTLPPGISRWLAWDLPHRVRRRTAVPLTVITAADPSRP